MTREHGLLHVSLLKHVKESEFLHFQELFFAQVTLVWFCHLSKKRSREMDHDVIDYCQGVKDVNLCSASPGRQESTPNFSTLLLSKKKKIITLTTYPRKKKA